MKNNGLPNIWYPKVIIQHLHLLKLNEAKLQISASGYERRAAQNYVF